MLYVAPCQPLAPLSESLKRYTCEPSWHPIEGGGLGTAINVGAIDGAGVGATDGAGVGARVVVVGVAVGIGDGNPNSYRLSRYCSTRRISSELSAVVYTINSARSNPPNRSA